MHGCECQPHSALRPQRPSQAHGALYILETLYLAHRGILHSRNPISGSLGYTAFLKSHTRLAGHLHSREAHWEWRGRREETREGEGGEGRRGEAEEKKQRKREAGRKREKRKGRRKHGDLSLGVVCEMIIVQHSAATKMIAVCWVQKEAGVHGPRHAPPWATPENKIREFGAHKCHTGVPNAHLQRFPDGARRIRGPASATKAVGCTDGVLCRHVVSGNRERLLYSPVRPASTILFSIWPLFLNFDP